MVYPVSEMAGLICFKGRSVVRKNEKGYHCNYNHSNRNQRDPHGHD